MFLPLLAIGQGVLQNDGNTIKYSWGSNLERSMDKQGLSIRKFDTKTIHFVQTNVVILKVDYTTVSTPSYMTLDSLFTEISSWLSSYTVDTALYAITSGSGGSSCDTCYVKTTGDTVYFDTETAPSYVVTTDSNKSLKITETADMSDIPSIQIGNDVGYTIMSQDTGVRLFGSYRYWDDLSFPVNTLKSVGTANKPDFDVTNLGLLFPANDTTESVGIICQMLHRWQVGDTLRVHLHEIQTSSDTALWGIKYRIYNIGETVPTTWTVAYCTARAHTYTSGSLHQLVMFPPIIPTGKGISCNIDMIIYRKQSAMAGDILLKYIDIHFRSNSLGSNNYSSKY